MPRSSKGNKVTKSKIRKATPTSVPTALSNINDTYANSTNTGTKKSPTDNIMSEDPNTYDRPPDSSINDNHVNDSNDSEPTPKNSPPENGDLSVSSTGNRRHSESHLVNETFKSVVERTIDDTVTEKPQTNTFHILKSFYDKDLKKQHGFLRRCNSW